MERIASNVARAERPLDDLIDDELELSLAADDPPWPAPTDKPARILIYAMNYAPELTGCGRYTGEIGAYLAKRGHRVDVVTTPPHYPGWAVQGAHANRYSVELDERGARITRCPLLLRRKMGGVWRMLAPLTFALSSAPVVAWCILRERPDTVFMVEPTLFAAPVALLAAKIVGARTVLHVQDLEIDAAFGVGHLKGDWLRQAAYGFERLTLKGFDRIVTISAAMRRRLKAKGVKGDRLTLVRNWVNIDEIRPLRGPNAYRAELGLGNDAFVVLYAGNIGTKQALHVVLDAAEQLTDDQRIMFVIVGEGPAKAGLVARGLPNVRFLPLQPEHRLCELLNLADLHVLPQDRGAADLVLPSKLGGMLASGRPSIVAADAGTELHEFLSGAALLVDAGDALGLAACVREATGLDSEQAMAKRGRQLAELELAAKPGLAALELALLSAEAEINSSDQPAATLAGAA